MTRIVFLLTSFSPLCSKNTAAIKAVAEREGLTSVNRDLKSKRAVVTNTADQIEVNERKIEKIQADETALKERKTNVSRLLRSGITP